MRKNKCTCLESSNTRHTPVIHSTPGVQDLEIWASILAPLKYTRLTARQLVDHSAHLLIEVLLAFPPYYFAGGSLTSVPLSKNTCATFSLFTTTHELLVPPPMLKQ
jgi:hypothetical protein